jgi:heterotetrameric sarcosine oxidase gamma subunit
MTSNNNHPDMADQRPTPLQQAGVAVRQLHAGEVFLREVPEAALARLRFLGTPSAGDRPFPDLPLQTGHCGGDDPEFLCLGPGEWLVISRSREPAALMEALQPATAGGQAAACDLSDGLSVLRLGGAAAPWLLAKLSCLDFVGAANGGRHCARTRMVDIPVTVLHHAVDGDEWVFDLISARSTASYLWALLSAAAPHANELNDNHGTRA